MAVEEASVAQSVLTVKVVETRWKAMPAGR